MPLPGSVRITTRPLISTARPDLSINGPSAWAFSIFTGSWAAKPINGHPTCIRTRRRYSPGSAERIQPHHRYGGRGDQVYEQSERGCARPAFFRLLRAGRDALAAP